MAAIVFSVFFLLALIAKEASAAQHVVGGTQGWDESTDFNSWASGQKFKVGDQLVFKYSSGLHSVVELPDESSYKSCDISSKLDSKSSGNDVVKLDKAGTRYFVCGSLGHCDQGMKVKITTDSGSAPSTPSSSSSSSSASTPAAAAASSVESFVSIVLLVAVMLSGLLCTC